MTYDIIVWGMKKYDVKNKYHKFKPNCLKIKKFNI